MSAKLSKRLFLGFLSLNILIGGFFGFLPLVNFPMVLELNNIPYASELLIFGVVSGTAILFLTAVLVLSLVWSRRGKWEGALLGTVAGGYLLVVGILTWIYTGDPTAFVMDSIRGGFTIFFGYNVYKSLRYTESMPV